MTNLLLLLSQIQGSMAGTDALGLHPHQAFLKSEVLRMNQSSKAHQIIK
jgi:hypothetical protein